MVSPADLTPTNSLVLVDPERIDVDAATYQFRSDSDAQGIIKGQRYQTDRWNAILHGNPILVHQRLDGRLFVADGHHRLDLARRSNKAGHGPGRIAAIVLRETDGYTPEDMRVIAAFRNMQRGDVDPVDGARVFKEVKSGAVHAELLPPLQMDKGNLRLSYTLSGLSDQSLEKVRADHIPATLAVTVAERLPDTRQQDAFINMVSYRLKQAYRLDNPEYRGSVSPQEPVASGFVARLARQQAAQPARYR